MADLDSGGVPRRGDPLKAKVVTFRLHDADRKALHKLMTAQPWLDMTSAIRAAIANEAKRVR